jgi:hypothetical protein
VEDQVAMIYLATTGALDLIPENVQNKTIYWGQTSKTLDEVVQFEKTLQKKYILCRIM